MTPSGITDTTLFFPCILLLSFSHAEAVKGAQNVLSQVDVDVDVDLVLTQESGA